MSSSRRGVVSPEVFSPSSRARLSLVAPAVLLVVATLQVCIARQSHLSAWKGGGFGMFSTIESPASRFLRISLADQGRSIPLEVPLAFRKLERELRTWPNESRAAALARRLAAGRWVPYQMVPATEHYRQLLDRQAGGAATSPVVRPPVDPHTRSRLASADRLFERLQFIRMEDGSRSTARAISFERIDVEVWQLAFDSGVRMLTARPLVRASAAPGS